MNDEREQMKQWIENWKTAGEELEKIRIKEMRRRQTCESMRALNDVFESVIDNHKILKTSGLVEQQRWFALLRKNDLAD